MTAQQPLFILRSSNRPSAMATVPKKLMEMTRRFCFSLPLEPVRQFLDSTPDQR